MAFDLSALKGIKTGTDVVDHVREIPIDQIIPDPNQPRKDFPEEALNELSQSIRENGLVQPIIVRKVNDVYVILAGERRYRACKLNGAQSIRAIISKVEDSTSITYLQMIENLQRQDLNPAEVADFICTRLKQGEKQKDIAQKLGISKSRVSEYSNWESMPDEIKSAVKNGKITNFQTAYTLFKQWKAHPEDIESFMVQADSVISYQDAKTLVSKVNKDIDGEIKDDSSSSEAVHEVKAEPKDSPVRTERFEEDYLNNNFEENNEEDPQDFSLQAYTEKELLKDEPDEFENPVILVTVGNRNGELLYKQKVVDGFSLIRWEDGTIENVYSETIRINRIVEG